MLDLIEAPGGIFMRGYLSGFGRENSFVPSVTVAPASTLSEDRLPVTGAANLTTSPSVTPRNDLTSSRMHPAVATTNSVASKRQTVDRQAAVVTARLPSGRR
jgi:hypothetical protein